MGINGNIIEIIEIIEESRSYRDNSYFDILIDIRDLDIDEDI